MTDKNTYQYKPTWDSWHQSPSHQAHIPHWEVPSCLVHHRRHYTAHHRLIFSETFSLTKPEFGSNEVELLKTKDLNTANMTRFKVSLW